MNGSQFTDEQKFALAAVAGCEITSSSRCEDGKLMVTFATRNPVGIYFDDGGRPVVVERCNG